MASSSKTTAGCGERSTPKRAGQLRDPCELVRHRREGCPPQPLQPPLEVEQGAVALEHGRARQHEIGPADGEPVEHRHRDDRLRPFCERADARGCCCLVADHEQQADRLGIRLVDVCCGRPGHRHAATVRCCREMEGAAAGLGLETEGVSGLGHARAAAPAGARPDQNRALRLPQARAQLASGLGQVVQCVARAAWRSVLGSRSDRE